jgi:hypothetical protein
MVMGRGCVHRCGALLFELLQKLLQALLQPLRQTLL